MPIVDLGAFSVSLAVSDLAASTDFYTKLGFRPTGGDGEHYTIMVNGTTVIGLFEGMFERNILTFNPGWSGPGVEAESFTDVRQLAGQLGEAGVEITDGNVEDS